MVKGFWENLKRPIVGLSPMDGITDASFRFITAKYGRPSVIFTEFTSAEGISKGATRLLADFVYSEIERPVVAQVFGRNPQSFYKIAFVVSALGFDGLDINMGCPDKSVSQKQGAGAGLIRAPLLAREIIKASKAGIDDYARGLRLEEVGLPSSFVETVLATRRGKGLTARRLIPVSVKTRLGFDEVTIESWITELLEAEPAAITIHGRTLKQLYSGRADWSAIARAASLARGSETLVLGNGDVKSYAEAQEKINRYGVDGVLIGRSAFGNPWVFSGELPSVEKKLRVMVEQARYFSDNLREKPFVSLRKNFGFFVRGFLGAGELRSKLLAANSFFEASQFVADFLAELNNFRNSAIISKEVSLTS